MFSINLCYTYSYDKTAQFCLFIEKKGSDETVVNEKRVKQMSKLAICENHIGKEAFLLSSYSRSDYLRLQELKALISVTIAYILCLMGYGGIRIEYILDHMMQLNYKKIVFVVVVGYLILCVLFFFLSRGIASKKYQKAQVLLKEYEQVIEELQDIYKEEKNSGAEERGEKKTNDNPIDF